MEKTLENNIEHILLYCKLGMKINRSISAVIHDYIRRSKNGHFRVKYLNAVYNNNGNSDDNNNNDMTWVHMNR